MKLTARLTGDLLVSSIGPAPLPSNIRSQGSEVSGVHQPDVSGRGCMESAASGSSAWREGETDRQTCQSTEASERILFVCFVSSTVNRMFQREKVTFWSFPFSAILLLFCFFSPAFSLTENLLTPPMKKNLSCNCPTCQANCPL